jgi:hypothetical protein
MYLLADLIFQLRVAGHLTKTFASHPVLCRLDETASQLSMAPILVNVLEGTA